MIKYEKGSWFQDNAGIRGKVGLVSFLGGRSSSLLYFFCKIYLTHTSGQTLIKPTFNLSFTFFSHSKKVQLVAKILNICQVVGWNVSVVTKSLSNERKPWVTTEFKSLISSKTFSRNIQIIQIKWIEQVNVLKYFVFNFFHSDQ